MSWSFHIVRTQDGERMGSLHPVGLGSWARRMGVKCSGSTDFHLGENPEAWGRMRPHRRTLVVCWDDGEGNSTPMYAGLITKAAYNRATGVVTVSHEDIWKLWSERFAAPQHLSYEDDSQYIIDTSIRYTGYETRTLAKRAVQLGLEGPRPDMVSYSLPILFQPDVQGTWSRTFRTYNWKTVAEELSDISELGSQPQADFVPVWNNRRFAWQMATYYSPPSGPIFHVDADKSPVSDVQLAHDMSEYASEINTTGVGQGTDTLHRLLWLGNITSDLVASAVHEAHSDIDVGDDLQSVTEGLRDTYRFAAVNITCNVALGEDVSPLDFTIGGQVTLRFDKDPIFPDEVATILLGFQPNGPNSLRLELAPVDGFTGWDPEEGAVRYRNLSAGSFNRIDRRLSRAETRVTDRVSAQLDRAARVQQEDG